MRKSEYAVSLGWLQEEAGEQIFEMLYNALDIKKSIDWILTYLGQRISADSLYLYEYQKADGSYHCIAEWNQKQMELPKDEEWLSEIHAFAKEHLFERKKEYIYCENTFYREPSVIERTGSRKSGAIFQAALKKHGVCAGFIGCEFPVGREPLTEEEVHALVSIGKVIGSFVLGRGLIARPYGNVRKKSGEQIDLHESVTDQIEKNVQDAAPQGNGTNHYTWIDDQERQILCLRYAGAERGLLDMLGNYRYMLRINLEQNRVEEAIDNVGCLIPLYEGMTVEDVCGGICSVLGNKEAEKEFQNWFSREHFWEEFVFGNFHLDMETGFRIPNAGVMWVKIQVTMRVHPDTRQPILFVCETDITKEKLTEETLYMVVQQGYDFVARLDAGLDRYCMYSSGSESSLTVEGDYAKQCAVMIEKYVVQEDWERIREEIALPYILQQLETKRAYKIMFQIDKEAKRQQKMVQFSFVEREHGIILVTCEDITDMVRLERENGEKLKEALVAAKSASQAKGEFLARMSHEMRTPMNAIMGLTVLALDEVNQPEAVSEYLEKIDSSSRLLLYLINDVLDMSKIESSGIELHPEPYSFEEFSEEIYMMIHPLCQKKEISFEIEGRNLIYHPVLVDKVRFKQIFLNLLSNAVKFTPEKGRISLYVEALQKSKEKIYYCFKVADNGIGMEEEFMQHMFEPFVQEGRLKSVCTDGSGLGLTISKNLVQMMGGTIQVQSQINVGTVFTVEMELRAAREEVQKKVHIQDYSVLKGKHILLCEDHPLNARIAIQLLEKKGMTVDWAEDGKKGVDRFLRSEEGYYNAVLMDIRMPEMDGIEATQRIRGMNRKDAATVAILAMTANAFEDDRKISKEAGMNEHLAKPIDAEVLYTAIAAYLV